MKYKILIVLVCIHLLLVLIRSFNSIVPGQSIVKNNTANALLNTYTQYSVMQADYSFFSPDVGPSPFLKIKVQEKDSLFDMPFNLKNGEMGLRLFTSLNAFNNTPEARELMARSWAAYALKKYSNADAITVEYFIKLPPAIKGYRMGERAVDSLMYSVKYQVNAE